MLRNIKICYKKGTSPKVAYFAGFCHHRLVTMSVHMLAYYFESKTKQVCKQSLHIEKI